MAENSLDYFLRRREQEMVLEAAATSPEAASVHRALGLIYAGKVRRLISCGPPLRLVASGEPQRRGPVEARSISQST